MRVSSRGLSGRGLFPRMAGFAMAGVIALPGLGRADPSKPAPEADRFAVATLATDMDKPMGLKVAPDGRVFIFELDGKLRVLKPGEGKFREAGTLKVTTAQENGLIGIALDPAFASNSLIYIQYSPPDFPGQHVSRFAMKGDELDLQSEKLLLKWEEQRKECCHHAGSMAFGPEGNLYVSTGDNTHPHGDSQGYAPIDQRPGKSPYDAQKSSSNTQSLSGKILRIKPTPEGGYAIPDGNLFPKDGKIGRPEIYVMGCRNPWRIAVDPKSGFLYWGEVGPDAGGDGPRGSRGYDEINQARKAGNFGWPYFVGANFPYAKVDFATGKIGPLWDPAKPINESPNNTGARELPPAQPAFIYYPYAASKEFPELGTGGRTACAGPVYHYDPKLDSPTKFPEFYDNALFFFEWSRNWIKAAHLDSDGKLVRIDPFLPEVTIKRPIDMAFGPEGSLYVLEYGTTWGKNQDVRLLRVDYLRGNRPPVAIAKADVASGKHPLKVAFDGKQSSDKDKGDALSYAWRAYRSTYVVPTTPPGAGPALAATGTGVEKPVEKPAPFSTEAAPVHTFAQAGMYVVELTVTDSAGASATSSLPVMVGNTPPTLAFESPKDGDFYEPGRPVKWELRVKDPEDGDSAFELEAMAPRMSLTAEVDASRQDPFAPPGEAKDVPPGLALMQKSDCFNCHAVDRVIVGPALRDVAAKYKGDPAALAASAERVRKGSSGVWGQAPMLPHPQHADGELKAMVGWVFGLIQSGSQRQYQKGASGAVLIPAPPKAKPGDKTPPAATGMLVLEASYMDSGAPDVGPLPGRAVLVLRPRRLEAEHASVKHTGQFLGGGSASGKQFYGDIGNGAHLIYRKLNLADTKAVAFRVSSGGRGGFIEVHAGGPKGALLAKVEVKPTGGWETWAELKAPLTNAPKDLADVCVLFTHPQGGGGGLMNMDWIEFQRE